MEEARAKLEQTLTKLSITVETVEHPEVFTVDAMQPFLAHCKGLITKNLFLKGKKKKDLWLISVGHDKEINLNDLAKQLSVSGGFRFADETVLEEKLCVKRGCVTPMAVLNDTQGCVTLALDNDITQLAEGERVYCHPMVNTATIGMGNTDLQKFLEYANHTPKFIDVKRKISNVEN